MSIEPLIGNSINSAERMALQSWKPVACRMPTASLRGIILNATIVVILVIAAEGLATSFAHAQCSKLPPSIPDRIGRVQLTLNKIQDKSVLVGKYDIIWTDYFYKPDWRKVPEIYSIKYMTLSRDPNPYAHVPNPNGDGNFTKSRDLRWYKKNHPDWVVYKCPGLPKPPLCQHSVVDQGPDNPAYQCYYSNSVDYIPLDITNQAVREFLYSANLGGPPYLPVFKAYGAKELAPVTSSSVISSGFYDAVGIDNLGSGNAFGECGIYQNGRFIQKYSGARMDSQILQDRVEWMNWMRQRVNAAGLCFAGNNYFDTDDPAGFLKIAATLDIVMDEHGFTRDTGPLETGAAWLTRINTLRALVSQGKPLMIVDYVSPANGTANGWANLSWSIANYLLIKGDRTYLALTSEEESADPAKAYPELFITTGLPRETMQMNGTLYWRHFSNALVIVNPSASLGQLNLGTTLWQSLDGQNLSGAIAVPPATALVLTSIPPR